LAGFLPCVLAGLLPADARTRRKRKHRRPRGHGGAPVDSAGGSSGHGEPQPCFPGAPCIVEAGGNLRDCDLRFAGNTRCLACNFTGANFAGKFFDASDDVSGSIFTNACLVGEDLSQSEASGVTFDNAVLCLTVMPDGSENNSGCDLGTPCCPTR
jgi:hypothetical protein